MNRFLRTASTRRLLAALAGATALVGGGTAIAVAATAGGPVAKPKPLAHAIHDAVAGGVNQQVAGITATVKFTNHLIDAGSIQGADPLLSGSTGRLWLAPGQMRLELQSSGGGGDAQLVVDHRSFWVYVPASKTVYRGALPSGYAPAERPAGAGGASHEIPSVASITSALSRLAKHLNLSGAVAGDTGGQPSYTVTASPKLAGGLLGSVQLAWDAAHAIPLRFAVYAKGSTTPVLELAASDVKYGKVDPSALAAAPPADAKTVTIDTAGLTKSQGGRKNRRESRGAERKPVVGLAAVAARLPFKLSAPATLAGRERSGVRLLKFGGHPAALVTYGHDLSGLAVLERGAGAKSDKAPGTAAAQGEHRQGLSLPTVTLPGNTTATELVTALGTIVYFSRSGVSYTVLGSVPRSVADEAAKGL